MPLLVHMFDSYEKKEKRDHLVVMHGRVKVWTKLGNLEQKQGKQG